MSNTKAIPDYTGASAQDYIDSYTDRPEDAGDLQGIQGLLGYLGLVPGAGEPFDLLNAGIYGLQGDYTNMALYGSGVGLYGAGAIKGADKVRKYISPVMKPATARYGLSTGLQEGGGDSSIVSSIYDENEYKNI